MNGLNFMLTCGTFIDAVRCVLDTDTERKKPATLPDNTYTT